MFEKITPEKAGISSASVREYISALVRRGIPMHSVLMMKGDKLFCEYYWKPFHKDFCHRMYSQTKSFVSVAIGLLEEEGKIKLDRPMKDYFSDRISVQLPPYLAAQTVREMLTMTTVGFNGNWFATEEPDRTRLYFEAHKKNSRPAGTLWEYDSAGSQVLSSLVEKLSGMPLFDYLNEKIFRHLGTFKSATILKTRNGDSWGDSAMLCTSRDMASFARFMMNYGTFGGKRLMNEEYLRAATAKQVDNSESSHNVFRHGYGYQIWRTEDNGFAFVGMGGQFTVCLPERDIIFVCTADVQGIENAYDFIVDRFFDTVVYPMSRESLPEAPIAYGRLEELGNSLELFALSGMKDSPFREELCGKKYVCRENRMGIRYLRFDFEDGGEGGLLTYENAQGEKKLPFGINKNAFAKFPQLGYSDGVCGEVTRNGFTYDAAISFAWLEEKKIGMYVQIIDRYLGNGSWYFAFKDGEVAVKMKKTAENFLGEYEGELTATTEV